MAQQVPQPPRALPAQGLRVVPHERVRVKSAGRVLIGGDPWRISRLHGSARAFFGRLMRAGPSGLALTPDDLDAARALLDRGFITPIGLDSPIDDTPVAIIVPVLDNTAALDRLLESLQSPDVLVVDDGSRDANAIREVAERHGARVVRHDQNRGPAATRNTGLAHTTSPVVAFIDSDCIADPHWVSTLRWHFADPRVAMVGPRIVPMQTGRTRTRATQTGSTLLGRYEMARSALDMGSRPALVRNGAPLGFIPSAALLIRRSALSDPAFTPELRLGEDVDLCWRLSAAGWLVRFDPASQVRHESIERWRRWLTRRFQYGTSAAQLEQRHPRNLAPLRVSAMNLTALGLVGGRRPVLAALTFMASTLALKRTLGTLPDAGRLAAQVSAQSVISDVVGLGHALRREWWPIGALALLASPRSGIARVASACMLAPIAIEFATQRPPLDPVRYTFMRLVDDAAYGTGVLASCIRARRADALRPTIRWPRVFPPRG